MKNRIKSRNFVVKNICWFIIIFFGCLFKRGAEEKQIIINNFVENMLFSLSFEKVALFY